MHRTPVEQASDAALSKSPTLVDFLPSAGSDFVLTPYVRDLTERALAYLDIGYPIHLSGPAGTGKSTLALHIAAQRGLPCTLLHGDDEYRGSDLVGRDAGYRRTSIRDNYVSSIVKTEESLSLVWANNRLTTACQKGHTLIYDEFTRSPATANNPFLSVLEEGILNIPSSGDQKGYITVHPNFRAIFTSNPEEYVGVHKTQDALLDRMITIELEYPDRETEVSIVIAKSNVSLADAERIVEIIRRLRQQGGEKGGPTVRAAIAIARILGLRGCPMSADDPVFLATCQDVLYYNAKRQVAGITQRDELNQLLRDVCGGKVQNSSCDAETTEASSAPADDIVPVMGDELVDRTDMRNTCVPENDPADTAVPDSDLSDSGLTDSELTDSELPALDAEVGPLLECESSTPDLIVEEDVDASDARSTDSGMPEAESPKTELLDAESLDAETPETESLGVESPDEQTHATRAVEDREATLSDSLDDELSTGTLALPENVTPADDVLDEEVLDEDILADDVLDEDVSADDVLDAQALDEESFDESLRLTLDTFEQLSTAVRHLNAQPTSKSKAIPRPPTTGEVDVNKKFEPASSLS
jgi:nitric oxide reductase NorQ protein